MITYLDDAVQISSDPPDAPPPQTSYLEHTEQAGRPSIQIPAGVLATALGLRGTTHLAEVFHYSVRTICCHALEYGLSQPFPPVYVDYEHLDEIILQIVNTFPNFGRRMINGHLKHLGHRVPRSCVLASYSRVHGAPASSFGPNRIQCRVYSVPGPNSLAHHDGQHG
jgi:hypothetical protein